MSLSANPPLKEEARHALIEENLFLVEALVSGLVRRRPNLRNQREDLIQDGTIGLIEAIDSYSLFRGASLTTWIVEKVKGALLMAARGYEKEIQLIVEDLQLDSSRFDDLAATANDELPAAEARVLVASLLQQLTPRQRDAIELHYLQGLNKVEVAQHMDISESRVRQLIINGLVKLKVLAGSDAS